MPASTTRHIVTSTLCAALLLGTVAAPALADTRSDSPAPAAPARTALQDQNRELAGLGTVLTPVTRLVDSALAADDDPLTAAEEKEIEELAQAAKEAIAEAREEAEEARKEALQERDEALKERDEALAEAQKEIEEARKEALAEAGVTAKDSTLPAKTSEDALSALSEALDELLGALTSSTTGSEKVDASADNVLEALLNATLGSLLGLASEASA